MSSGQGPNKSAFSQKEAMQKRATLRSLQGIALVSPFFINRCSNNLKSMLDEREDEYISTVYFDAFHHRSMLREKDVEEIQSTYFWPDCLKIRKAKPSERACNIFHQRLFVCWSGLAPSISKSTGFLCNCDAGFSTWFDTLSIPRGTFPIRFLGVPLISSQLCVNDCMPLIDQITSRLHSWATLLLSLAGRVMLIRSVVHAIEAFWGNHFLLPATIHHTIQSMLTRFLWKGNINHKGGAKVAWTSICLPREEGGLDLKNMIDWNRAQIIHHLIKVCGLHHSAMLSSVIHLGAWRLPRPNSRHHHLDPLLVHWLETFDYPAIAPNGTYSMLWDGLDAIKIKTWHIWNSIRNRGDLVPWSKAVWHRLGVTRYAHHQWLICHRRLNTLSRLHRFGIVDSQQCFLCIGGGETISHLFVHCTYSKWILSRVLAMLGLSIAGDTWLSLLNSLIDLQDSSRSVLALCMVQIFCYHVWRERNARAHNKGVFGPSKLLHGILVDLVARLQSSVWFNNLACNRPDLHSCISCIAL
ncbi:uncharacterized protein LOC141692150 [Apium graveolens]|uniref:uncharacterized protein LOC141692150 n=1 Tax=Apium graveolens TaxID=4045 RepID=UPI003D7BB3AB